MCSMAGNRLSNHSNFVQNFVGPAVLDDVGSKF
jgi:hypothetical protein